MKGYIKLLLKEQTLIVQEQKDSNLALVYFEKKWFLHTNRLQEKYFRKLQKLIMEIISKINVL